MKDASKHPLLDMFPELLNGVGYVQLGEVCEVLTGGEAPNNAIKGKEPIGDCKYPIYSNGIGENALWGFAPTYRISKTSITFSSIGTIGFPTIRECCYTPIIRLKVIYPKDDTVLNVYFLKYVLEIVEFEKQKSSVPNINANMIKSISIPLPPLPVQEAIVNILDRFAEYAAELQAELQARQQQYNYYRDTLLSFEDREDVQEYILGDLFEFKNGLNASKEQFGHGTPIVNYVNVYKKNSIKASDLSGKVELDKSSIDRYRVKRGDVFFTRTSETREEIGIASVLLEDIEDCVFSGFVLRARPITDVLLPEFCKYCFSTYNIRKQIIQSSTLTTRALTNGTSLSKVKVLIPSKPEQHRIVDILDRFDTLVNDLSQGLPAEIEARQQQYEYYRDKLLTFKRK